MKTQKSGDMMYISRRFGKYISCPRISSSAVRQKSITDLSQTWRKSSENVVSAGNPADPQKGEFDCPCGHCNLLIINKKTRKPLRLAGYEILERAKGIEGSCNYLWFGLLNVVMLKNAYKYAYIKHGFQCVGVAYYERLWQ